MKNLAKIFLVVFTLSFSTAFAASITTVKGNQVLIDSTGSTLTVGQQLMAKDSAGKNRAILKVTKLGKNRALAEIVKGKAEVGYNIAARRPASVEMSTTQGGSLSRTLAGKKMGVVGSYLMNTMNAKFSLNGTNYTASMKGTGFGVLGYYDYPIKSNFEARGLGGVEQFVASESKSTALCDSGTSSTCNVNITYLSLYGLLKYKFLKNTSTYWAGGGMGYLLAASKSSTVLDISQVSTNQVFTLSAGVDVGMKNNRIMPISLDYSLFPSSGTVTASMISVRVGWGWGK